jgi:HD-GYP domain-containing protein (c-di-GMP phosphodiesterase class II)
VRRGIRPNFGCREILKRTFNFSELSEIAASHHEKLNCTGYFRGMAALQLNLPARILAVADIYDALAANRPYRTRFHSKTLWRSCRT